MAQRDPAERNERLARARGLDDDAASTVTVTAVGDHGVRDVDPAVAASVNVDARADAGFESADPSMLDYQRSPLQEPDAADAGIGAIDIDVAKDHDNVGGVDNDPGRAAGDENRP